MNKTQALIHTDDGETYHLPFQAKTIEELKDHLNLERSKSNFLKCVKPTDRWPYYFLVPFEKISYVEFDESYNQIS